MLRRGGSRTILVTGATGNVGRYLVPQLVRAGAAVRALSRRTFKGDMPTGVEHVTADLAEPESLGRVLDGVESVFLLWPFVTSDTAPALLDQIARYTRRVVFLSSMGWPDAHGCKTEPVGVHAEIEGMIERLGLEFTFLRASGFATNTLMWAPQIRSTGTVRWSYGAAARSPIHERDIAAVATRALTEYGHAGARYAITGPQSITLADQVGAIGGALGRQLFWKEIPREAARRELPRELRPGFADAVLDAQAVFVDEPELVTQTVAEVTGAPAHTFWEWARDHTADFSNLPSRGVASAA